MATTGKQRTRRTAEERRRDVLEAALVEFAIYGLHGASTVTIAERAGISQPYVLRLFSTKKALFLETVRMAGGTIRTRWEQALAELPADATPRDRLHAIGAAYQGITSQENVQRILLQAYSAAADDDVRQQCQAEMDSLFTWVREETGVSAAEAQVFFAQGMLIMVGVAIGAPRALDQPWARAFMLQDVTTD